MRAIINAMRLDIAYALIVLLAGGLFSVLHLTRRYQRYDARRMRGHSDKPVWKPFWMR
jgi:hypothetical protein